MRRLHAEHHRTQACNEADSPSNSPHRSSRPFSSRTSRCPRGDRRANWALTASSTSCCECGIRGCRGNACLCRQTRTGHRPCTLHPCPQALRHGPMMGHCGRPVGRVSGLARSSSRALSACSRATGPTPWPHKGRGHRLRGPQARARREGHRHDRHPWLRVRSPPRGPRP